MVAAAGLAQWCQQQRRTGAFLALTPVHPAAQDGGPGLGGMAAHPKPRPGHPRHTAAHQVEKGPAGS